MLEKDFWTDKERADLLTKELSELKKIVDDLSLLTSSIEINYQLVMECTNDDIEIKKLLEEELISLRQKVNSLSTQTYLNAEYDDGNAIIEIHDGAGGTESWEWVNMHYRMYSRY